MQYVLFTSIGVILQKTYCTLKVSYWSLETTSCASCDASDTGWEALEDVATIGFDRKTTRANLKKKGKLKFFFRTLGRFSSLVICRSCFKRNASLLGVVHNLVASLFCKNINNDHRIEFRTFHNKSPILWVYLTWGVLSPILFFERSTISVVKS